MSGKGSARRPKQITEAELDLNWYLAFGGKQPDPTLPAVVSGFSPVSLTHEWQPDPFVAEVYEDRWPRWSGTCVR